MGEYELNRSAAALLTVCAARAALAFHLWYVLLAVDSNVEAIARPSLAGPPYCASSAGRGGVMFARCAAIGASIFETGKETKPLWPTRILYRSRQKAAHGWSTRNACRSANKTCCRTDALSALVSPIAMSSTTSISAWTGGDARVRMVSRHAR
jgi:hypothetical protein